MYKKIEFWGTVGFYGYYQLAIGVIAGIFIGEFIYTLLTNNIHPFHEMCFIGILSFLASFLFFDLIYRSKIIFEITGGEIKVKTSQYNFISDNVKYDKYIVVNSTKSNAKLILQLEVRLDKNMITFSEMLHEDNKSLDHSKKTNLYIKYRKLPAGTIDKITDLIDEFNAAKDMLNAGSAI